MKSEFRFYFVKSFWLKKLFTLILLTISFSYYVFATDDVNQVLNQTIDEKQALKQAEKLTRRGELLPAETLLKKVLTQNPNNIKAKLQLSYVYLKSYRYIDSHNISFDIAEKDPKNARAFALLGGTFLGVGNFKDAFSCLQTSLLIDGNEALAHAGMGMLRFYENQISIALEHLREAVFLEPNESDFMFTLAQVSARAERYKEAADSYARFLQLAQTKDDDRRARIKGLIGFLNFLGSRSSLYNLAGADYTSVSIEIIRDRPVIKLKINGKDDELRFVLDTGSGISVLSEQTAERLKIKSVSRGGHARAVGGNGKFEIVYGFLKSIEIGDTRVQNVPVYIRKFHDDTDKADGYIGLGLISKFLTTLDYQNKTFSLNRQRNRENISTPENNFVLPLRLTSSGFLSGEVQLQGVANSLNFIVDTGASISVISEDLASLSPVNTYIKNEKMRVIGAAGVTENVSSFLLPRLTFGKHSRESLTAIALDLDSINEASGFLQAGILGGNFLKNYRLTFDFINAKVRFEPNLAAK